MTRPKGLVTRAYVERLGRKASRLAMAYFGRATAETKADHTVVTKADRAIEAMLVKDIRRRFPDHGILGEEGARTGGDGPYLWALDPIDGTSAYARGLPFFAVSIALLKDGLPHLGFVSAPALKESYFAIAGLGAWQGRRRLRPLRDDRPYHAESLLLLTSNAHRRYLIDFAGKGRCLGSTAAQICYVARGTADGAIVRGSLWDVAAAYVILKEVGGEMRYLSGVPVPWAELLRGRPAAEAFVCAPAPALSELARRIARKP